MPELNFLQKKIEQVIGLVEKEPEPLTYSSLSDWQCKLLDQLFVHLPIGHRRDKKKVIEYLKVQVRANRIR